jgi:arylsulfatase A-like enzyme
MRLTDSYGQQSCTAGRAAFITGQYPYRTGLTKVGMPGVDIGLQAEDIIGQAGRWQSFYHDAMVEHDKHVGQMLDLLDELGIAEDTIGRKAFTVPTSTYIGRTKLIAPTCRC